MADAVDGLDLGSLQSLVLILRQEIARLDSKVSLLEAASAKNEGNLQSLEERCHRTIAGTERKLAAVEASCSGVVERINILSTEQRLHHLVHKDQEALNMARWKKCDARVKLLEQTFSLNEMD